MSETADKGRTVPFGPWKTFKSFIETDLKAKTVPAQIDSSLFKGKKSGTDARQLRAALRYYGLVEGANDATTDRLRAVVKAYGTDAWKQTVSDLVRSYDALLSGVDVSNATQKELNDAFREHGNVTGNTLTKAVRLYLAMATEAGVKLSPHFVSVRAIGESAGESASSSAQPTPKAATNGNAKPRRRRSRGSQSQSAPSQSENGGAETTPPANVDAIRPLPGSEFRVWIPHDMPKAELEFAMKYLRDYLKLKRGDLV